MAKTLIELSGGTAAPARLSEATLLLIDIQNEYSEGPLAVPGFDAAAQRAAGLLERARALGTPVIHVRHMGRPGGAFDPEAARGRIHAAVTPAEGETVVEKTLPNAFAKTTLDEILAALGARPLVVAGFMTHMCVSSTVRAALDRAIPATVAADATGTRALPDPLAAEHGGELPAEAVHRAALAALADRFAAVVPADRIPD